MLRMTPSPTRGEGREKRSGTLSLGLKQRKARQAKQKERRLSTPPSSVFQV
jgi:hypothetical protein